MEKLREICNEYLNFLAGDEYHEDNDYTEYIFEAAMEAIFGQGIWDKIHELMDMQEARG